MTTPKSIGWRNSAQKQVVLFGMSGLGKTHVSNLLRASGDWFHYSIDYRIGTRYMGEFIDDNLKREAMRNPFLANLLRTDSVSIAANMSFENLAPLSTYLGRPGDPAKGGLPIAEYEHRQSQHARAEISALMDTPHFIARAHDLYRYSNFVCDTGGSICEVVDPYDPNDPVLRALSKVALMVWIKGTEDHTDALVTRFNKAPKPMCYTPAFLTEKWEAFLQLTGTTPETVDPDDFIRYTYAEALAYRQPRYAAMAKNWGISVTAEAVASVRDPNDFNAMIEDALNAAS